jgi:hypothetical protein
MSEYIPGAMPRRTRYGQPDAERLGLKPLEDTSLAVIPWDDIQDALKHANERQTMPIYHQHDTWAPVGFRSDQDGLPLCWAWSATASMMDLRALESKETIMLSPVSLGWLVNWQQRGYYLDETIQGMRERGISPIEFTTDDFNGTSLNHRGYDPSWEKEALKYRLNEVWDVDTGRGDQYTIQQAATILCAGRPIYIAYNWWSHALMCTGMRWNESKKNNIEWLIRNSHNEDDVIIMDGNKGVPDEMYGFVSSVLA